MNIEKLRDEIKMCRACKNKFGFAPKPIVNKYHNSKIMHISQAPSKLVHETGRSFNDKSGEKLKYEWYQITDDIFYNEKNFYITSMAHCYPGKSKYKGDNVPPKECLKWLAQELALIDCEIYVVVGALAAKYLFPGKSFDDLVFNDNYYNGRLCLVLPHPSPLNSKWFKDHPDFAKRLVYIRKIIHKILKLHD